VDRRGRRGHHLRVDRAGPEPPGAPGDPRRAGVHRTPAPPKPSGTPSPRRASALGLVVAPNVATLYEAADASAAEIDRLFDASVELLADLATALEVPALVSAPRQ